MLGIICSIYKVAATYNVIHGKCGLEIVILQYHYTYTYK